MDDLILEKNLKETLNKKSEEIGGLKCISCKFFLSAKE